MHNNPIISSEYDTSVADFKYRIFKCVDKYAFVFLYAFNKDVLHLGLVAQIRELGGLSDVENENLEETVWATMDYIIQRVILTSEEISDMLALVGKSVNDLVRSNRANIRRVGNNGWDY